uniref:Cystatin domain-containing protein n=1 Tax=Haemonchus placei TaxID=6290 RepID=A0A0N4X6K8_HAEPC
LNDMKTTYSFTDVMRASAKEDFGIQEAFTAVAKRLGYDQKLCGYILHIRLTVLTLGSEEAVVVVVAPRVWNCSREDARMEIGALGLLPVETGSTLDSRAEHNGHKLVA